MKTRLLVVGLLAAVAGLGAAADALGCGDKFLVGSRGTRYQRPRNARAASILIYAVPESAFSSALKKVKADSVLKHEGHRSTTVGSLDQLTALLAGGRFDVVLTDGADSQAVERLVGGSPDAAVVVGIVASPKSHVLLTAIDKAVERRDQNLKKLRTS